MKKLATLLLAAGMVVAASAPASAVDIKVDGQYWMDFQVGSTYTNDDYKTGNNYSAAQQRVRLGIAAVASENLSGYFQIQNDENWGNIATNNNGNTGTIKVRCAYIDWTIPGTAAKVRMGRQLLALPNDALGQNLVMQAGFGTHDAIAVSAPVTDWLSGSVFWTRGFADGNGEVGEKQSNDAFGVTAKIKGNGFTVEPWAMYADIDKEDDAIRMGVSSWGASLKGDEAELPGNAYWFGATATVSAFDPFKLVVSAAWSQRTIDGKAALENVKEDRQGWYAAAKATYKTAFGTPFLAGWISSGDDKDDYKLQGQISSYGGRCRPLFGAMNGSAGLPADSNASQTGINGTWGAMTGITGVSFVQNLSHNLYVAYVEGTNDKESDNAKANAGSWTYLTEEDSYVEFGLANTYKIYKNLSATLELSYTINDFDSKTAAGKKSEVDEDAWRSCVTFQYKF